MSDLSNALNHISDNIKKYRECDLMDGNELLVILQQITGTLHYLESVRGDYHHQYQAVINKLVLEGSTVSRAENQANIDVPQMYMLRHIMTSAYEVVGAIRTTVSYLKTEKHNSI